MYLGFASEASLATIGLVLSSLCLFVVCFLTHNVRFITERDLVGCRMVQWKPSGMRGLPVVQGPQPGTSSTLPL